MQALPQAIQHAPFQGVRQPLLGEFNCLPRLSTSLFPRLMCRPPPRLPSTFLSNGIRQPPQVVAAVSYPGHAPHYSNRLLLPAPPQFIHQPVPVSIPQGLPQSFMQANQHYMPPYTSVTPQKLVHKPGPMRTSRPAKRQAEAHTPTTAHLVPS